MASELVPMGMSEAPELLGLAEEVRRTGQPRLPRRNGEDLAVLAPAPARRRPQKVRAYAAEDDAAFLASAGSWKGNVDVERFLADLDERRRLTWPPVEL